MELILDFEAYTIRPLKSGDLELENPDGEIVHVAKKDLVAALEKLFEENM